MRFAHPAWLVLIWLAPLVFVLYGWGQRRRSRVLAGYAEPAAWGRLAGRRSPARRWAAAALAALAVLWLAVALAGPRYGFHWRDSERRGVDLLVAVDCSRSMLAEDTPPSRLARAKREVVDLLNRLEGDRVGLVAFAGTAFLQCPLTLDYAGLHIFLQALTPEFLPVGGTALAEALDVALRSFDPESAAERAILLITDGEETSGAAAEAAERARQAGVRIYVLGVGTPEGAPIPLAEGGFQKDAGGQIVLARLGEEALRRFAALTGGGYARAVPGDADLEALYTGGIRAAMEAQTLGSERVQVWEDRYQWPLGLAVLALLLELGMPLAGRTRRGAGLLVFAAVVAALGAGEARAEGAASLVRLGLERYRAGDFPGAQEAFARAQVHEPTAPEIAFDLGNAQYREGDFEGALASYGGALLNAPEDLKGPILYNRGNAAYRLGRLEDAARDYAAALDANPDDQDARLNLGFVERLLAQQPPAPPPDAPPGDEPQSGEPGADENSPAGEQGGAENPDEPPSQGPGEASGESQEESQGNPAPDAADPGKDAQAGAGGAGQDSAAAAESASPDGAEPGSAADRQRAQALLNRLQDQPGKALMPAYRKRRVDKDW